MTASEAPRRKAMAFVRRVVENVVSIQPHSVDAMSDGSPAYSEPPKVEPVRDVPRRKGLSKKQLAWARKRIPHFADCEAKALASKLVSSKAGRK